MFRKKEKTNMPGKLYFAVLTLCVMLIIGASAAAYNITSSKAKKTEISSSVPFSVSVTEKEQNVNVPATNIPKTTESTSQEESTSENPDEAPFTGEFAVPTKGKIIGDYSADEMVKSDTMGDWRIHSGTDFSCEKGESVFAVQNGTVTKTDKDGMWGVTVEILCAGDMSVKYCGLADTVKLKKGDRIEKGGIIGEAGEIPIEKEDGTHIHLEVTVNGKKEDPVKALNLL